MLAERARLVDVLAALSLTTDLATGLPFERGLRACLVADGLARALDLDPPDHRAAFLATLLRAIGCGHASENAALFGDDIAFERFLATFDIGDEAVAGAQLAAFETAVGTGAMQTFLAVAPTAGPMAVRASCEVAVALGTQLTSWRPCWRRSPTCSSAGTAAGCRAAGPAKRCTRSPASSASPSRPRWPTPWAASPRRAPRSAGARAATWTRRRVTCSSRAPRMSSSRSRKRTISSHLSEDVAWDVTEEAWTPHAAGVPWLKPRRGRAEVAEFFAIAGAWQYERFEMLDLLVSETRSPPRSASSPSCRTATGSTRF
jgi:hypothetical protein